MTTAFRTPHWHLIRLAGAAHPRVRGSPDRTDLLTPLHAKHTNHMGELGARVQSLPFPALADIH